MKPGQSFLRPVFAFTLLLAGCGADDACTTDKACPPGPAETPNQERWGLATSGSLTSLTADLGTGSAVRLDPGDLDLYTGGVDGLCDTTAAGACARIDVVLELRAPTIEHHDSSGELAFVSEKPKITSFGRLSLVGSDTEENVFESTTLDVRTCSRLQTAPPDGPFRGQGHQVSWAGGLEFRTLRSGGGAVLRIAGLPMTLTNEGVSCDAFELYLSGELELERLEP